MANSRAEKRRRNMIAMRRTAGHRKQEEGKEPVNPLVRGACNAKKRNGDPCRMKAGFRTDHPGIGTCYLHGGFLPSNVLKAKKQQAILMGAPKEINPVDALYWCIKITAGEVEWLSEQIAELDKENWFEITVLGKQMNILVRERKEAVERLAGFSKTAISLGLAERAVRLAENYGIALSRLLQGVLGDLELTPEQQERAPLVVRKHLVLLEGGNPISKPEQRALLELEAGDAK